MQSGYVAMLDVLGFSGLVRGGDQTERKFGDYLTCVQNATKDIRVAYVVFSDTMVLTTEGGEAESLLTMAQACSRLFHDLLKVEIPIRGAIAFGNFFRSTVADSVFVAGSSVLDAFWFEQQQDWVGVMLAPSARVRVPDLADRCKLQFPTSVEFQRRVEWAAVIQHCDSIPFHNEVNAFDGFAVVPRKCKPDAADLFSSIKDAEKRLEWLRDIAPSPASQRKYRAALQWLSKIPADWRGIADLREQGLL